MAEYKAMVETERGAPFPMDPNEQLWGAIGAVFGSWMNPRANTYRRLHEIPANWGTAVNVQAMVFGNMGQDCATGVCFTRDPSTGENMFYGEFLVNAQGEDVVAGIRTPQPLSKSRAEPGETSMEEALPGAYADLLAVREKLERHYLDMQDIEFTVQQNKLYMLQTRNGKRTAAASAPDRRRNGRSRPDRHHEAIKRVSPGSLDQLLHPTLDPKAPRKILISSGLPASPGAASGIAVFNADEAEMRAAKGEAVILVRIETSPGGHSRHARRPRHPHHPRRHDQPRRRRRPRHGPPLRLRRRRRSPSITAPRLCSANGMTVRSGETITLDGATGEVFIGSVAMIEPHALGRLRQAHAMGRQGPPPGCPHQCRNPARRRDRSQIRRRRHRPVAAPSTCSSTLSASAPSAR